MSIVKELKKIDGGLNTRYSITNIDDEEFGTLRNFISWHGSVYNKAGTQLIGELAIPVTDSTSIVLNSAGAATFSAIDIANNSTNNLQVPTTATLAGGSLSISDGTNTWTETNPQTGNLVINNTTAVSGAVLYNTTAIAVSGGTPNATLTVTFQLYPAQPVVGFASLVSTTLLGNTLNFQQLVFDTQRAYVFNRAAPSSFQNVLAESFFQESGALCLWHGTSYQLFQTASLAQAVFISNQTPCMQLAAITGVTVGTTTTVTTVTPPAVGEYVWINEVNGVVGINGQTVQVTAATPTSFSFVLTTSGTYSGGGIFQFLTSAPNVTGDGLRYYYKNTSGDYGFVNYAPPLSAYSATGGETTYICGCRTLLYYGNRLCLFGVWVATSTQALAGEYTFLPNSLFYSSFVGSEVGSPFYTVLNPVGAIYTNAGAFYQNPPGQYGGSFLFNSVTGIASAYVWKLQYAIVSFFGGSTYRLEISSNALFPYKADLISPQFGSMGTNAGVALSEMVILASKQGVVGTNATTASRIDFPVPDAIGSIAIANSAPSRVICMVDNVMEAVFITYPSQQNSNLFSPFPDTTLFFNYRENKWALLDEQFTCYGQLVYTQSNGITWSSATKPWSAYSFPWTPLDKGYTSSINACGNQAGFIFSRSMLQAGSGNAPSLNIIDITIQSSVDGATFLFTVFNHNMSPNMTQYIYVDNCIGTVASQVNGKNFLVVQVLSSTQFVVQANVTNSFTYLGLGTITLVDNLALQTKAFDFVTENMSCINVTKVGLMVSRSIIGNLEVSASVNTSPIQMNIRDGGTYEPVFPSGEITLLSDLPEELDANQSSQKYVWKQITMSARGQNFSLIIRKGAAQMADPRNNNVAIEINSIAFLANKTGNLFSS